MRSALTPATILKVLASANLEDFERVSTLRRTLDTKALESAAAMAGSAAVRTILALQNEIADFNAADRDCGKGPVDTVTLTERDLELGRLFGDSDSWSRYEPGDTCRRDARAGIYSRASQAIEDAEQDAKAKQERVAEEARKRQPIFEPCEALGREFWLETAERFLDGNTDLGTAGIADAFEADERRFIEVDSEFKGNARAVLRLIVADIRMDLLAARAERKKLEARVDDRLKCLENRVSELEQSEQGKREIAKTLIDNEGYLVLTFSDGSTESVGRVVGRDGRNADDIMIERVVERLVARSDEWRGEDGTSILDAGTWTQSKVYAKGAGVTYAGSFWISQIGDNRSKPGKGSAWRLAVKRGRDGRDNDE